MCLCSISIFNVFHMSEKKPCTPSDETKGLPESRRDLLKQSSLISAMALAPGAVLKAAGERWDEKIAGAIEKIPLHIEVNGIKLNLAVEPRVTLLDLLREEL